MNKLVVLILCVILCKITHPVFASDTLIKLNNKHIQYVGRWDKSDQNNFHSYWGGAYFDIKFRGNLVKINLLKPVNIYVQIDGGEKVLFKKASGWVKLTPDTLTKSTHHIRVIAKFQDDEIDLAGIAINEGGKLLPSDKKKTWIEFIGDSITSGDRTSTGNTSAYSWLTPEYLGSKHTHISYCGIPLTNGYQYNYKGAPQIGMESAFFNLQQPNHQPNQKWMFKKNPNLVVVNLGTNDHNLKVSQELFLQTFTKFIKSLRSVYPKSSLAILIPFNQSYINQLNQLIQIEQKRDKKLSLINTQNWLNKEDYTDGIHPNDGGHIKITNQLVKILAPILKN